MNNDAPAPDPQVALNNKAMAGIAERQQTLAEQSYARQNKLTDEFMPMFRDQIAQSTKDAETSRARGDAQWQSYTNNFQPLEKKMADTAMNFDTAGRREQEANTAIGDVATRFGLARDERNRSLSAAGVDPNSGRAMAFNNAAGIEQAKAEAGGANAARKQVEMTGMGLLDNATRFGRNMPSTGLATAALASQQTGQAGGQIGGLTSLAAQPAQMASAGLGQAGATLNQSNAGFLDQYRTQSAANSANNASNGQAVGSAVGLAAMYFL